MCEPRANRVVRHFFWGGNIFLVMSARSGAISATFGQKLTGSVCVRCKFGVFVRDFDMEPEMALNPEKRGSFDHLFFLVVR